MSNHTSSDSELSEPIPLRPIPKLKYRGLVKEEKLFQPSSGFGTGRKWPEMITVSTDPMILNTVHLMDYKRKIEHIINGKKFQIKKKKIKRIVLPFAELPPMPEVGEEVLKRMNSEDLVKLEIQRPLAAQFSSENQRGMESNFVRGIGNSPPPVSELVAHQILKKTVIALCGHAGFRGIKETALQTFTDVAGYYLTQFCKVLRVNVDRSEGIKAIGYIDALEQTFQDVEGSSMLDLVDFYQERVIKYHSRMMFQCKRLIETYKQLEEIAKRRLKEQAKEKEKQKSSAAESSVEIEKGDDAITMENLEQFIGVDESDTPSLDCTTVAKGRKKRKKPKKLLQGTEKRGEKLIAGGDDDYFEDLYASELFPDHLSLSIDENSSSEAIETKRKRKLRRARVKPDASKSAASENVGSVEEPNVSQASASASGKGKQITSGTKEPKKRVSQKTLKKVTNDLSLPEKKTEESGKEEPSPKIAPAIARRRKGILKNAAAESPGLLIEQISDSLIAKKKKASIRFEDPSKTPAQDETLGGDSQVAPSTSEKPACIETISQTVKEKQKIQLLKKKTIEEQKEEAVDFSLQIPVGPIESIGTQFIPDELVQSGTKTKAIPVTCRVDKGKKKRAPPKPRAPEPTALGIIPAEFFPLHHDLRGLIVPQQQFFPTLEMKEPKKRQPSRRKISFPAPSPFVPIQGGNMIPQMMFQPPETAMDLSSVAMSNMMEVPLPLSPIGEAETGRKKRRYKRTRT